MIDTHCHLLPRLDDGPSTVEEAVLLARKLSEASVTTALCTTHYSRQYPTLWSDVLDAADSLQRTLAAEGTPLTPSACKYGTIVSSSQKPNCLWS